MTERTQDVALTPEAKIKMARQFMDAIPHSRHLGMVLDTLGDGKAVASMPWAEKLVGDPETGVIHGGAVSALMDATGGAAVMCHPASPATTATIDMRIDYMRPANPGQKITARAECFHVTRTVAFVRAVAEDEDAARPVAMMTATYTVQSVRAEVVE